MKKILFLIIGLLAIFLTACQTSEPLERLDKPISIVVNKNVISYEQVLNATGYIINVNGTNIETSETTYTLVEEGTFNVRVKAVGEGYRDSLFSELITVNVSYLNKPTNIRLNSNDKILYDGDVRADYYIIEINGETYHSVDDEIPVFTPGSYEVRVQAVSSVHVNSEFSDMVTINYGYLNPPTNIEVVNGVLVFTKDPRAHYHIIKIIDVTYDTRTDILPIFGIGTYDIQIKSMRDGYIESEFSDVYTKVISEDDLVISNHSYQYSTYSTFNLLLFDYQTAALNLFELEMVLKSDPSEVLLVVDPENLYIYENAVYLKAEYLKSLKGSGNQTDVFFKLKTNVGDHLITISITADQKPYVSSDKNVRTDFHNDISFRFDVFGTTFIELSAEGIKEDDYTYQNGVITIKNDYIVQYFQANLTKDNILITYRFEGTIEVGGSLKMITYLGFISIKR